MRLGCNPFPRSGTAVGVGQGREATPRGRRGFTLIEVIGALVVFSAGVLMLLGLIGVLSMQMTLAAQRSVLAVEVQDQLDSLQAVPYDSLPPGSSSDTILVGGRPFLRTRAVLQSAPLVKEVQVTIEPADGSGPRTTASSFVQREW